MNETCEHKIVKFSYPFGKSFVLGAQKNRLIEMVLFSTHNICFHCEKTTDTAMLMAGSTS